MPRLYGERIMLREYKKDDLTYIRKWVNDPKTTENLSGLFVFPHTMNATEKFLNERLEDNSADYKGFIIAHIETEEYIGQIDLFDIDWVNRAATLGIIIGDDEDRGRGYGSEAIMLLEEFVFNRMNLNRLELGLREYNTNGYKCYLKCGFKEEGRKRQDFFIDGRYTDSIIMSILKSEYASRSSK